MSNLVERDPKKNIAIKKRFIKHLNFLGWKVAIDMDPECKDPVFDISMMLHRSDPTKKVCSKSYGFLRIGFNDKTSLSKYEEARLSTESKDNKLPEYLDRLDRMIYPYDINDIVAYLLHSSHNIEEFYTAKGDEVKLKLTPKIISELIDGFTKTGSPLIDPASAPRPKKVEARSRSFINMNPVVPK